MVSVAPTGPLTPFSTLTPGSACKKCQMPLVGVARRGAPWHRVASGPATLVVLGVVSGHVGVAGAAFIGICAG